MNLQINESYENLVSHMSTQEYVTFKWDIKERGLLVPITVNNHGIILEGHHRFKVCKSLGIEPNTQVKDFADILDEKHFVIECNLPLTKLDSFSVFEKSF